MPLLRKLWNRLTSKLFYKILIVYSLLTVIPLVLIISLFYVRTTVIIEEKMKTSSNQTLVETVDKIDGLLKLVEQQAVRIANSFAASKLLNNDHDPETYPLAAEERELLKEELLTELQTELKSNPMLDAIYLFNTEGGATMLEGTTPVLSFPAISYIANLQEVNTLGWAFFTDQRRATSAMKILNRTTELPIGYVAIMLKPEALKETYASYNAGAFYITNANNLILSANDLNEIDQRLDLEAKGREMVVNRRSSYYTGFTYTSFLPKKDLNREIADLAYYAIGITLAAWIIVFLLTFIILKHITKPLVKLSGLMRRVEREEFYQIGGITTNDEIAQLCASFNQLVGKIKYLIEQVYKAELLKKEADLKMLKMHLNPHFLYNTLESVSIMARSQQAAEIPQMVDMLSKILRSSIAPTNDFVPLETEIQLATAYLQLYKYRYKERLAWSIDMEDGLESLLVPKLILQPIVENAIMHGVDQLVDRPGQVAIRAYEHQFDLLLEVEDNGPGFTVSPGGTARGLGTGLDNVESRLKLLYGGKYGVTVKSREPSGTIVQIRLPIILNEKRG
ncbi:sensor histidine kinase [Paenibacillus sp. GCM10027626]|uniref:sensor histidine kinase n=1 Tax=Paenibacillus sp. GCM10027626 TaxID=3273411 RepID=UPI003631EC9C